MGGGEPNMTSESPFSDENQAAYQYVEAMLPQAHRHEGQYGPCWYGWALRDAFLAGIKWQAERQTLEEKE